MPDTASISILESLVQALEQMAFVAVAPVEGPPPAPASAVIVRIEFHGAERGNIELLADESLGAVVAANILAAGEDDPQAQAQAQDALCELLNVTCGDYLRQLELAGAGTLHMSIPGARRIAAEESADLLTNGGFDILDAEGRTIAIRLTRESQ